MNQSSVESGQLLMQKKLEYPTCEDAVAVAVEAGPDDARVDAVHRHVGARLLQPRGELPGVQHVGELGHRVRLRRVVGSAVCTYLDGFIYLHWFIW
jgi:hypothetical protein